MLILLVTEENRIEIEFSDSLGHVFDADWCHELLYTEVVPFFKEDKYADGLERILILVKERLMDVRGNAPGAARKKGRRRAKSGALLTIFGAYATRAYWRNLLFGGNNGGGGNHPPEGDDGDSKYLPPRAGKRGGRRLYGRGRRQRLPAYEEEYRYNPPPNSSSFLHGLGRLMGLATGRTKIGPTTKSAGNNINIVWKPAPPNVAPPPYIEATRTATTTTTVNQEDVVKPIIGQSSSAAAAASSGQDTTATTLPPEPSDQEFLRSHPGTFLKQRERLELEAKKRAELKGRKKKRKKTRESHGQRRAPLLQLQTTLCRGCHPFLEYWEDETPQAAARLHLLLPRIILLLPLKNSHLAREEERVGSLVLDQRRVRLKSKRQSREILQAPAREEEPVGPAEELPRRKMPLRPSLKYRRRRRRRSPTSRRPTAGEPRGRLINQRI